MRLRLLFVPLLCLGLAGCAGGPSLPNIVSTLTQPVANVTPAQLNDAQRALTIGVRALNVYGNLCVRKVIAQSCWTVIERIQPYTRQARALLPQVRRFVRENDQVNAIRAFNELRSLIQTIQQESAAQGVT